MSAKTQVSEWHGVLVGGDTRLTRGPSRYHESRDKVIRQPAGPVWPTAGVKASCSWDEGATLSDVLAKLEIPPELSQMTLVNGQHCPAEKEWRDQKLLQEGDVVSVFSAPCGRGPEPGNQRRLMNLNRSSRRGAFIIEGPFPFGIISKMKFRLLVLAVVCVLAVAGCSTVSISPSPTPEPTGTPVTEQAWAAIPDLPTPRTSASVADAGGRYT